MPTEKYTLYLDESATHNGSNINPVFCMAGVIIKNSDYPIVENELNNLKRTIWGDKPNPLDIIIHQSEVNDGQCGRARNPDFTRFRSNRITAGLYSGLSSIYSGGRMTLVGAVLSIDDLNTYFCQNGMQADNYLITLQLLIENYCHFLCYNNGVGDIIYESRDDVSDERLRGRFYSIKFMGSMYVPREIMMKKLTTMQFKQKHENVAGLQIADFAPNYYARILLNKPSKRFNIDNELRRYRYDGGGLNLRDRFGVKYMP